MDADKKQTEAGLWGYELSSEIVLLFSRPSKTSRLFVVSVIVPHVYLVSLFMDRYICKAKCQHSIMPAAHMALRGDVFFASLCFYEAEHGKDLVVLSGSC